MRQRLESLLLRANEYQEKIENRLIKFNEEKNDITQQIKQMAGGKDKEEKLKAKKIFGQAAKRINPDRENLYNAYTEIGMMIMHGKNYLSWLEKIGGVYKE